MEIAYLLFFAVVLLFVIVKTDQFIFFIPVFNVFMDISFNFFPTLSIATYARPTIILIYLVLIISRIGYRKIYLPFYIFFTYIIIQTILSDELVYSLRGSTQAFLSMMMFVAGFELINTPDKFKKLLNSMIWVMIITLISTGAGYVFGIGRDFDYSKDEQTIGLLGSGGMYASALGILLLPLITPEIKKRWIRLIIYLMALLIYIFILLNLRRTAILMPVIGYLVYLILIPRKGKVLTSILAAIVILLFFSPFYSDLLLERFEVRREQGRFEEDFYETEGRYLETKEVLKKTFSFTDPGQSIFGKNIFASGYSDGKKLDRILHTDHAVLLAGGGILGFTLYLLIYISLLREPNRRLLKYTKREIYTFRVMYYCLIVVSIFVSLNGSITQVTYRSVIFLFIGALLSVDRSLLTEQIQDTGGEFSH